MPEVPNGAAYNPADVAFVRTELGRRKVGQVMLRCTHPTGVFGSAGEPTLALGADGRSLTGQVVVRWVGAAGAQYQTTYSYTLGRGSAQLRISDDTAAFKSKVPNVKQAEQELARINGEVHRALAANPNP
jgi:hypothetical protein